jgi:hypothetical protein
MDHINNVLIFSTLYLFSLFDYNRIALLKVELGYFFVRYIDGR